ncbi:hypothetical protein ACOM2C_01090 [Pseudarthrobacter sp. So.54]
MVWTESIAHPITRREQASLTAHKYTQPRLTRLSASVALGARDFEKFTAGHSTSVKALAAA